MPLRFLAAAGQNFCFQMRGSICGDEVFQERNADKKDFSCLHRVTGGWKARAPVVGCQKSPFQPRAAAQTVQPGSVPSGCRLPVSTQQRTSWSLGHCRAFARCSEMTNKVNAPITAEGQSVALRTDSVTLSMVDGHNHSRTPTAVVC